MMQSLTVILEIQEKDLNMLRLMDLKKKRKEEMERIIQLRRDLEMQLMRKESEVLEAKKDIKLAEAEVRDAEEKLKRLEGQQGSVKKVEEFNALTKEISETERSRVNTEQKIVDLTDHLAREQETLEAIRDTLLGANDSSKALEVEIQEAVSLINREGRILQEERARLAEEANPEVLWIYERLLSNKRDRVIVPVENRTCSGCHIVLTAQHENLVRKGERLVFCEHCSRIHYWLESEMLEGTPSAPKRRRRRAPAAT